MPWTATFAAETADLERGIDRVEGKLKEAGVAAENTSRGFKTLEASFSGTKITKAAQDTADAIAKVGGVTKLTAEEQVKANRVIQDAITKYQTLEKEAPEAIRKLSAELQEATAKTKALATQTTQTGGMMSSIKGIAAGMFAGFSAIAVVQGLKNIAGSALDTAGMLTDLSAQTGIAASSLDRIRGAAKPAGVELTTVTNAVSAMSDKLVSGDKSAAGALNTLGLSLDTLSASKPDEAFLQIVEGLSKIPDPMERTKVAFDIFGGKAKEVLRLVNTEFIENARNGKGMSEATIAALDEASDAWEGLGDDVTRITGGIIASIYDMVRATKAGALAIGAALDGARGMPGLQNAGQGKSAGIGAPGSSAFVQGGEGFASGRVMGVTDFDQVIAKADKAAIAFAELTKEQNEGWAAAQRHLDGLYAESRAMAALGVLSIGAAQGLDSLARSRRGVTEALQSRDLGALTAAVSGAGFVGAGTAGTPLARAGAGIPWGGILSGIPSQLVSVFSGGNVGQGLGSLAGGIGGVAGSSALGLTAGSFLGSAVPVLGTLVGGLLGKWLGGLFGPSKREIANREATGRIQQTQAGLISQYGSVGEIAGMGPAGQALAAAWGSRGTQGEAQFTQLAAAFAKQIETQNKLLTEQAGLQAEQLSLEERRTALVESLIPKWDTVNGLMEKYGISLDGAGKQVQQLGTTGAFTGLINDIETLNRAGIDTGGMLLGMADEISDVVSESIRLGTEIPLNMKPYLESLARAGKLTDENGEAITDLSQIKFGAPIVTEADKITLAMSKIDEAMSKVVDRLAEIADYLARILPKAAEEGAAGVDAAFGGYRGQGRPSPDGEPSSSGYAAGGVVTRRQRAWIGEGGQPEIVGPVDFMASALYHAMARAGMSGGGSGDGYVINNRIDLNGHELGRQLITIVPEAARRAGVRLAHA